MLLRPRWARTACDRRSPSSRAALVKLSMGITDLHLQKSIPEGGRQSPTILKGNDMGMYRRIFLASAFLAPVSSLDTTGKVPGR